MKVANDSPAPGWAQRCSTLAAFLVPAAALAMLSGYSWGAVLLLLAALATLPRWATGRPSRATLALATCFLAMASLWLLEPGALDQGWAALDRPLKFVLAVPCLLFVAWCTPPARALLVGVLVGAGLAGATALLQRYGCDWGAPSIGPWLQERCEVVRVHDRVSGYTNAIQFGGISLLLALMGIAVLWTHWSLLSRGMRVAGVTAIALGLEAWLLSMTRGGALAIAFALPLLVIAIARYSGRRALWVAGLVAALLVGALGALKGDEIADRLQSGVQEVQQYRDQGQSETSVGHRMAHWQLAWAMAMDRPWTGWTQAGYEREKARRVQAGQAPPVALRFGHAHNEVLDMLAKRGLVGLAALLALYLVPLILFWPTRRRVSYPVGAAPDPVLLSLRMVGSLLPLCYVGLGLTQAFFAHNSGVMFYLFMVALVHGAIAGLQVPRATAVSAPVSR